MSFFEASAKTGVNVKEAFYEIAEQVIDGVQRMNTVSLMKTKKKKKKDKDKNR